MTSVNIHVLNEIKITMNDNPWLERTSRDRIKSALRSIFKTPNLINMQRTLFLNFYQIFTSETYAHGIRIKLEKITFPLQDTKNNNF